MAKKKNQKSKTEESAVESVSGLAALASSELSFLDDATQESEGEKTFELDAATEAALIEQELGPASIDGEELLANDELGASSEVDLNEEEGSHQELAASDDQSVDAGELSEFSSAEVEDIEKLTEEKMASIVESLLFATDKPLTAHAMKAAFQGTNVRVADIRKAIELLKQDYACNIRGVSLEEVAGGYQLRTKAENQTYLLRTVKTRPFRVSGPALEVLSIVAYKQPCTKASVDEIRGVESGHLMRGLLDRGLIAFGGKSELPGRPMLYETTRRFLETFSLRNIKELPTLSEIDELIPEGIGEEVVEKPKLSDLTGELSQTAASTYSENEEELIDISKELSTIDTTSAFFEEEKRRAREKRDQDRAQDIRDRLTVGEEVEEKDRKWLAKYDAAIALGAKSISEGEQLAAQGEQPTNETVQAVPAEGLIEVSIETDVTTGESNNEQGTEPTA